jgi:hypothetical protein
MPTEPGVGVAIPGQRTSLTKRKYLVLSVALIALHIVFMLFRYGQLPSAPVFSDEVIINDPSISLSLGHGYIAESFADSKYGLDRVYAHFPPVYPYTEALAFKVFGISAYSLRLTTTVMSIGSTLVLLFLLYRLCVFGLMSWDVALLVEALYCTNASYLSAERTARMESMISLLVLLSLCAIIHALTVPAEKRLPWLLAAGGFGALTIAVHPGAVTAVLMLAALMLFLVPTSRAVRVGSAALFVLIPLAVGIGIYRANFFTAIRQFLAIAHDSNLVNPTSYEKVMDYVHGRNVSSMNHALFLVVVMVLLVAPALAYFWNRRTVPRDSVQYRLSACMAVVGVIEILVMIFAMRMVEARYIFLFGALLVCNALCLWGSKPLLRWEAVVGWSIVALQCIASGFYLYPRQNRIADSDPNRFMAVVQRLPRGVSVTATPGLWLDMKEANRPFTVLLNGLDGEVAWGKQAENPLNRFDVVVLEKSYSDGRPWLKAEAQDGRRKYEYPVGSDVLEVYVRSAIVSQP